MKIYQLNDNDGETCGLLSINAPQETIQKLWTEYNRSEPADFGIEEFMQFIVEQSPDKFWCFQRTFIESEINP